MNWFWLGVLPIVIYLLLLWFFKVGIDWDFDNAFIIFAILICWIPFLNWTMIGSALFFLVCGYKTIPFKDNKFNRWLFGSRFRKH